MTFSMTSLGIMSGTSLDGLDLACCRFEQTGGQWAFEVLAAETIHYDSQWKSRLEGIMTCTGPELAQLHAELGAYIGQQAKEFMLRHQLTPDIISSHGHTIFHRPDLQFTFQAGCGAAIAAATGIDTVCDFRSTDIALGGQGAPLVPVGDRLLFGGHRFCLNLGGISNISFDSGRERMAFDICPVNMALNFLAGKKGLPYDDNGEIAASGRMIPELFDRLEALSFYSRPAPKSLGREWFDREFKPLIDTDRFPVEDLLHTVTQHIASCIGKSVPVSPGTTMLVTGGGAYNIYLQECLADQLTRSGIHPVVPDSEIISFKEAIIFAFLGILRITRTPNALKSVTGASSDSVGGAIYCG